MARRSFASRQRRRKETKRAAMRTLVLSSFLLAVMANVTGEPTRLSQRSVASPSARFFADSTLTSHVHRHDFRVNANPARVIRRRRPVIRVNPNNRARRPRIKPYARARTPEPEPPQPTYSSVQVEPVRTPQPETVSILQVRILTL